MCNRQTRHIKSHQMKIIYRQKRLQIFQHEIRQVLPRNQRGTESLLVQCIVHKNNSYL
jgi:ribosomal protein L13